MSCPKKLFGEIELSLLLLGDFCKTKKEQKALDDVRNLVEKLRQVVNENYDIDRCKIK